MEGPSSVAGPPVKRQRVEEEESTDLAVVASEQTTMSSSDGLRTSSLPSPTIVLSGHKGSVYALEYSPSGDILCSTSFDMTCLLWDHTKGYENFNVLVGHKNAVLDCAWCDEETVVTASADKTLQLWDITTGQRLRKWQNHTAIVNACSTTCSNHNNSMLSYTVVSASDDGTCRIWDRRQKSCVSTLETEFPILAVALSSLDATNPQVFTAGIDDKITCWDVRQQRKVYAMKGHTDTITSLAVDPQHSTHLLSNSMDQTVRIWDIKPFVTTTTTTTTIGDKQQQQQQQQKKNRHVKTFTGHKHSAERGLLKCSWSSNASMVTAGSADRMVHVWDEYSTEELYLLPGHKGCVNAVTFHPKETNVIASGSSDKQIYVGELS